ncbi:MAG TPA: ACP S-malonyltransferase [Solirubrobacteraceae bacterium]
MISSPTHSAYLFPGQGSSVAGTDDLVAEFCGELVEQCRAAVGDDLFARAGESTRFAQPAIFLASLAGWRSLDAPEPLAFAGHSLGELSALAAAGVMDAGDALELVILRGALMAEAADRARDGGMLAVLKGTVEQAEQLADAHGVTVANDNAPGQVVLSGRGSRLKEAAVGARELGVRAIVLDVAGAFHSPDMASACPLFRRALGRVDLHEPSAPVISGVTAQPFEDVRGQLAAALTRPVRWRETMQTIFGLGVRRYVDVGPDAVLAKLVGRNVAGCESITIDELSHVHV